MGRWLQSGLRRDLCVLLYGADGMRGQRLKTRIEEHYDRRIEPKTFYGALDALVGAGYVEERADGIHDVYALTGDGRVELEDHCEWLGSEIAGP